MSDREIINLAIQELKESENPHMSFKNFSFMSDLKSGSKRYKKIRDLLLKSEPFEQVNTYSIALSKKGYEVANNFNSYNSYLKSKKRWYHFYRNAPIIISFLILISSNVYQCDRKNESIDFSDRLIQEMKTSELQIQELESDAREKKVLHQVMKDLITNDRILKDFIEVLKIKKQGLETLFNHIQQNKKFESKLARLFAIPGDNLKSNVPLSTYDYLQEQGLAEIDDEILHRKIKEIFREEFGSLMQMEEETKDLNSKFKSFRFSNLRMVGGDNSFDCRPNNYKTLTKSKKFEEIYDFTKSTVGTLITKQENIRKKIDEIWPLLCNYTDCSLR